MRRVVVTGVGVVSSLGIGKDVFWKNLIQGKSGISKVESFDTTEHPNHYGGEVKDFSFDRYRFLGEHLEWSRASQLGVVAAYLALSDACLTTKEISDSAVIVGTTAGESQELEKGNEIIVRKGEKFLDAYTARNAAVYNVAVKIAQSFGIKNTCYIFTTACAAGNYAIGYGFDLIRSGRTERAIVGGTDAFSYIAFTGFNQVRAVAPQKCQPFDKNRKGMIVAEGAGFLILENLDLAKKRGAYIYGEILGYGLSCDAYHMIAPLKEGMIKAIQKALRSANIVPEDVDYICAHGTGTYHNDKNEAQAINAVFGGRRVPVSSIKSMLGHAMGAASAIEAVACCLLLKEGIIFPTINYETPDPECDIDCVPNQARYADVNVLLNNSFAFGGNNSCLVMKRFEE